MAKRMCVRAGRVLRPAAWLGIALLLGATPLAAQGPAAPARGGAGANPSIGLVLTGYYGHVSADQAFAVPGFVLGGEPGAGEPGFNLGESELSVYGNVDPYFFGSLVLAVAPEEGVELENAFLQTTALPWGLIARAGRFFSGVGYLNDQHRDADDFFDAPLPYQVFLGGQYADDGLQLRWLAPTDVLLEAGLEIFRGEAFPAGGAAHDGAGTGALFVRVGGDIGVSQSYLLSISQLQARADARTTGEEGEADPEFSGDSTVRVLGLVWKWAPQGNPRQTNLKVQLEYFQREETGTYTLDPLNTAVIVDLEGGNRGRQSGWYAQTRYQFLGRWRTGLRHATVHAETLADPAAAGTALDGGGHSPAITSAMLEFLPSDFSRIRLQYNSDRTSAEQTVGRWSLHYIVALGAHAPHAY